MHSWRITPDTTWHLSQVEVIPYNDSFGWRATVVLETAIKPSEPTWLERLFGKDKLTKLIETVPIRDTVDFISSDGIVWHQEDNGWQAKDAIAWDASYIVRHLKRIKRSSWKVGDTIPLTEDIFNGPYR